MCVRVISPFPLGLEKRAAPAAGHAGDSSGFSAGPARAHGTMLVQLWFFARFQPGKWVTSGAGDPRSCFVAHSELRRWQAGVQITNSTGAETGARGQKQYIYIYIYDSENTSLGAMQWHRSQGWWHSGAGVVVTWKARRAARRQRPRERRFCHGPLRQIFPLFHLAY